MDGMYGLHSDYSSDKALMSPDTMLLPSDFRDRFPIFGSDDLFSAVSEAASINHQLNMTPVGQDHDHMSALLKAKIAAHPSYPRLLQAYIDCQKVGAPPEITSLLDEIRRENQTYKRDAVSSYFGTDPELDEFMETYCDILDKYKTDLARPFDEATTFLNTIEMQLSNLCTGGGVSLTTLSAEEGVVSSEEDFSGEEIEVQEAQPRSQDRDLKDKLLRRFGNHIGTLKLEFSKKKKKGKLPREARQTLLSWWNVHYRWPYPTEADKIALAESTGLDQKQINNWFINQRKRHWKPSENMQFGVMNNLSGQFYAND